MSKQVTRAFASGLLLSALFLIGYKLFFDTNPSVKAGYIEIKKSEYTKLQQSSKMWEDKNNQLNEQKANTKKQEANTEIQKTTPEETVTKYRLKISEGMTPDEVSSNLKSGGIIKDEEKFLRYLIDNKFEEKVQIGEYDLTSKMDFNEIAKVITKNR